MDATRGATQAAARCCPDGRRCRIGFCTRTDERATTSSCRWLALEPAQLVFFALLRGVSSNARVTWSPDSKVSTRNVQMQTVSWHDVYALGPDNFFDISSHWC